MAELFGLISAGAGLASLAFQLGESAVKARRLYLAIKEAPETLQHLAFEMDTFSLVLHEMASQGHIYDSDNAELLIRCVRMCEQSVSRIKGTINKLESLIQRHSRLGVLRATVEDKDLSKVCVELERAKTSLGIALQLYSEYQRARDREILHANYKLASEHTRLLQTSVSSLANLELGVSGMPPSYREDIVIPTDRRDRVEVELRRSRYRLPNKEYRLKFNFRFVSTAWELCVRRSFAGWDMRLRMKNIVPKDAEIFNLCRDGDLDGVRKLFQDGLASPCDYSSCGLHSALKDAMRSRNLPLCRFVMQSLETDATDVDEIHDSLGNYAWTSRFANGDEASNNRPVDMYRLMIDCMDLTEDNFLQGQWWEWSRDIECMKLAQNAMLTPYMDLSWQTRFQHAMELAVSEHNFTAEMFLQPLGCLPHDPRLAASKTVEGLTLFHAIAAAAGSRTLAQLEAGSWIELARGYVTNGGSVHCQDTNGASPLTFLLDEDIVICFRTPCETTRLRTWLQLLSLIGVDLMLYGSEETTIWQANAEMKDTAPDSLHGDDYQAVHEWSFGPTIEDWSLSFRRFTFVPVYEALAAPGIPGTWEAMLDNGDGHPPTIAWTPVQEDESGLPLLSTWNHRRTLKLVSDPFPAAEPKGQRMTEAFNHCIASKAQDDASEIVRLIETTQRSINRPRSQSQPRLRDQRVASETFDDVPRHSWLPTYHICGCDSKRRLAPGDLNDSNTWVTAFRRCMHGYHQTADIWRYIDRRMRQFRRRFQTREELEQLPFQAYKDTSWRYDDWWEVTARKNYYKG